MNDEQIGMNSAEIQRLREQQEEIRRRMPDSSEGKIEAAIRETIGCTGPVKLRPSERRPPAPQYPTRFSRRWNGSDEVL